MIGISQNYNLTTDEIKKVLLHRAIDGIQKQAGYVPNVTEDEIERLVRYRKHMLWNGIPAIRISIKTSDGYKVARFYETEHELQYIDDLDDIPF